MPANTRTRSNAASRGSKKPATNVLAAMSAAHWAIQPDLLRTMCAVAGRLNPSIDAIEAERGQPLENTYDVTLRDGIATIPVHGAMFRYADYFSYVSGGATYEGLSENFLTALNDPQVRGILFDGDTGGGEVHGCQGLSKLIRSAIGTKPMAWFAAGDTCSAGYWLAAASGLVYAAPTSILGSIGCCTIITDFSKWQETQGIEEIQIVSSQSPKKNRDPAKPEGRADIQAVLDAIAGVFVADVAEYRDVTMETVLEEFGQGGVFVGAAAVDAGLADAVGTYDDVHAELLDRASASRATTTVLIGAGRAPTPTVGDMKPKTTAAGGTQPVAADTTSESTAQPAAADTPTDPAAPEEDQKHKKDETTDEEPMATRLASARKSAATAERTRILGIQALRRNASEDATITACVNDEACTVEAAALRLRQAETAAGTLQLDALRQDEKNHPAPKHSAPPSAEATTVDALSDRIANAGKPAAQRAQR